MVLRLEVKSEALITEIFGELGAYPLVQTYGCKCKSHSLFIDWLFSIDRRTTGITLSWYWWAEGPCSVRAAQTGSFWSGGSWHVWRGGHSSWTSCHTADTQSASLRCVCGGAAVTRLNGWSFYRRRASYRWRASPRHASADVPSGERSSCTLCRTLGCGRCAVSSFRTLTLHRSPGSWGICSGGSGVWSSAGPWRCPGEEQLSGVGGPKPAVCLGRRDGWKGWRWFGVGSTIAARPPQGLQAGDAWLRSSGGSWESFVPHCCAGDNRSCWPVAAKTALWQERVQRSRKREFQPEGWEAAHGGGGDGYDDDGDPGQTACVRGTAPWAPWRSSGVCWGLCWVPCRCSRAGTFLMWSWRCSRRGTGSLLSP